MASTYCPRCGWEIPLHDTDGKPVHEQHARWCDHAPSGVQRKTMEIWLERMRAHYMHEDTGIKT